MLEKEPATDTSWNGKCKPLKLLHKLNAPGPLGKGCRNRHVNMHTFTCMLCPLLWTPSRSTGADPCVWHEKSPSMSLFLLFWWGRVKISYSLYLHKEWSQCSNKSFHLWLLWLILNNLLMYESHREQNNFVSSWSVHQVHADCRNSITCYSNSSKSVAVCFSLESQFKALYLIFLQDSVRFTLWI